MSPSSAGCQTCKIRRIKCDEDKPVCQRCTKSRRICLEASTFKQACFSIHLENCYASGSTKRPRGPRSSLTVLGPQFDLHTRALAYYLQHHIQTLTDLSIVSESVSECVGAWKASGETCPMVDLAVTSMALAVYARTQHNPLAVTEAFSTYHRLLEAAQERIVKGNILEMEERNIDAFLLVVLLMARYEATMQRSTEANSSDSFECIQLWSHQDGAMSILKLWTDHRNDVPATLIIKQIRRGLIKSSLLRNMPLPEWMLDGNRFGEDHQAYDRIVTRAVNLHHAMLILEENYGVRDAKAVELDIESRELDQELQDWVAQFPSTWLYQRHVLKVPGSWPRRHFHSSAILNYPRLEYGVAWSHYFAMRMLINSMRWRIRACSPLKLSAGALYDQQQLECINHLYAMAEDLASTIPFVLERFKVVDNTDSSSHQPSITLNSQEEIKPYLVNLVVWPLTIASSLEGVDGRQQLWFRSELATLGKVIGAGVLEKAETAEWAAL